MDLRLSRRAKTKGHEQDGKKLPKGALERIS
jgi:hypothetical protein